MKISIIGAAGMIGRELVAEAQSRGLEVTAYTRSGNNNTHAVNFFDTSAVNAIVDNSDVTIISIAGRADYQEVEQAHRDLIASRPAGRIIVIGGAGSLTAGDGLLMDSPYFPAEYLQEAQVFSRVLEAYRASEGLNWTMVAPSPEIAPGTRTGEYVTALDVPAGDFISTQDFAVAVIDEAEEPTHKGRRFTAASVHGDEAMKK